MNIPSTVDGYLGSFQFLEITHYIDMDIVHIFGENVSFHPCQKLAFSSHPEDVHCTFNLHFPDDK